MTFITETHIPKTLKEVDEYLLETEVILRDKLLDLDNKQTQKQLENSNENSSNKRESL